MIVKLEESVCEEMLNTLIEAENTCPPEEDLHVYLSTPGGSIDDMSAIINIINESEKISKVFCFSGVFSAGFVIAITCLKPVEFLDGCLGMAHRGHFSGGLWTDDLKVHKDVKEVMKLQSKKAKQLMKNLIDLDIFTKKEVKKLKAGKDVYFDTERMREMRDIFWSPIQEQIDEYTEEYLKKMKEAQSEAKKDTNTAEVEDITTETEKVVKRGRKPKKDLQETK